MGSANVKITGLEQMVASLQTLSDPKMITDALAKSTEVTAKIFYDKLQPLIPVRTEGGGPKSTQLKPGQLRDGLVMYTDKGDKSAVSTVTFRKDVKHVALFVEYGHMNVKKTKPLTKRGKSRKTYQGDTPAHPFMRPAFDQTEAKLRETLKAEVIKNLTEAAKR
ncbi:HK97-gp10 family putative phage morphogenesis protein [Acidipila sp. EB88]|uniref:HK97-gp10 family putative phage morphogenesis protein n=1 Tax=Acidipila sp. EB88 TaxID=2305226 RepID=UPI000F5F9A3E|nr:HK97-gp10 family putative phage morphogenesis protein [Acidipila sp. EB88]RRA49002.1 hypothetical protein D1Y84_12670 [Acidipila sp. EB88]